MNGKAEGCFRIADGIKEDARAAVEALKTDPRPMVETYARRREYICRRLREMGKSG